MAENRNLFRARRPASGERNFSRACLLGIALAVFATLGPVQGQEAGLKSGAASIAAGKYDSAVRQLSATINSESVSRSDAARALYLRGIAYRKLGQPSKAIADLGAAIWLGLAGSDKVKALVNRGLAFRAAGLSKQASAELSEARSAGGSGEVDRLISEDGGTPAGSAAIAAFDTEVLPDESYAASSSTAARAKAEPLPDFATSVTEPPAPPKTRTADASPNFVPTPKPPAGASSSWSTSVSDGSAAPQSGNRVSRWFGSLTDSFGSSDDPAPGPAAAPTPAPVAQTAPRTRKAEAPAAPAAADSSWTTETQTDAAPSGGSQGKSWAGRLFSRTAEAEPSAAPTPAAASGGSYRLQLATSRSEGEAKALWQKVSRQNQQLASASPQIEKVDIGNLGTFYSLRVGPFSNRDESTKVCNALKRNGVDCSLVTPDME